MATNIFHTGQKLTAADLNNAIDSIAGVQNPSNDYKWQQTSLGRMQTTWSTFLNSESEIASPLDIGVAVQQLDQPIFVGNQQISGVRRLFMNVGNAVENEYFGQRLVPNVPRIGTLNGFPFAGVIGAQFCSRHAPYGPKDGNIHFSMWANFGEDVEISAYTPAEWTRVQKLYDDDVARNASPTNWWYTGICIENQALNPAQYPELFTIKCYPMYVPVAWKDENKDNQMWYMPFLVVCTAFDTNLVRGMLLNQHGSTLKQLIEQHFGDEDNWNVQVLGDPVMVTEPTNEIDIAQYVGQPGTISQQYKQLINDVKFVYDFSAGHIHGMANDKLYDLGVVQYIDSDGVQKVASAGHAQVTDLEGNLIDADDCQAMLAMAYCFETKEAILSCVSCDYSNIALAGEDDPVQKVLEPLFTSFEGNGRTIEKRLIWVNRCGARGMQYFDTCPSFFKQSIPDSSVSALEPGLSSLQAKTREFEVESIIDGTRLSCEKQIWSLYDFDNLDNVVDLPTDKEELEKYNMVVRYVEDDKAQVKYISLSSLSATSADLSVAVDSEGASGQKSIAWLEGNELELYKMEEAGISVDTKLERIYDDDGGMNPPRLVGMGAVLPARELSSDEVEFVIRKGGAGGEIDYAKVTLSAQLSAFAISGDTNEGQDWPQGEHAHRSVETKYNSETGNLYHQIYNFDDNTTQSEELQLSAGMDNYILPQDPSQSYTYDFVMRKHDTHNFESEVDYLNMNLKMPLLVGDSQISGTHDYSLVGTTENGAYKPMLYNWHGGSIQHVHVKTDGESYYWPQDTQTPSDGYYFLVKHQTTGGDWVLEYKQLIVDMPDINIDSLTADINQIFSDIMIINGEIDYLSGVISSAVSGDYWELGGDQNTCYGAAIGDEDTNIAINLNNKYLNDDWSVTDSFGVGHNLSVSNDATVGGTLTIGNTTMTEAQLSALLQLVQVAPQLLRQV